MDENFRLELLKLDIMAKGSTIYDPLLKSMLSTAEEAIRREGIIIDFDVMEDNKLVSAYAAYLWRQRDNPDMQMPRNLRYQLNNKLFSQHLQKRWF